MRKKIKMATKICLFLPLLACVGCVRRYAIAYIQSDPQGAFVIRKDTGESLGETPVITPVFSKRFFVVHRTGAWMNFEFEKTGFTAVNQKVWISHWGRTPLEGGAVPINVTGVLQKLPPDSH